MFGATMVDVLGWTVTSFDNAIKLPKLLISGIEVAFQGHHIIPTSVFLELPFLKALAAENLWSGNKFSINGVALPSSLAGAEVMGASQHLGSHPAYTQWVKDFLAPLEDTYRNRQFGALTEQQWLRANVGQVNGLTAFAKTQLYSPSGAIRLLQSAGGTFEQFLSVTRSVVEDSAAFKAASKVLNGASLFDATPGLGGALDPLKGTTGSALASSIGSEVAQIASITSRVPPGAIVQLIQKAAGSRTLVYAGVAGVGLDVLVSSARAAEQYQNGNAEGSANILTRLAARIYFGLKGAAAGSAAGLAWTTPAGPVAQLFGTLGGGLVGGVAGAYAGRIWRGRYLECCEQSSNIAFRREWRAESQWNRACEFGNEPARRSGNS